MPHIEIPAPVIKAEVAWGSTEDRISPQGHFVSVWPVNIEVGGVIVMRREFDNDYLADPENPGHHRTTFASDAEEAQEQALTEFGRKIRDLIGEEQG